MDNEIQHIKFRGGKLSAAILGLAFLSVIMTKFLPTLAPDYSQLGALTKVETTTLGCIDHELNVILREIYEEVHRKQELHPDHSVQFALARDHALQLSGNMQMLITCSDELKAGSAYLFDKGQVGPHVDVIHERFFEIFKSRATMIALRSKLELCKQVEDGVDKDCNVAEINQQIDDWSNKLHASWSEIESSVNVLSHWIADTVMPSPS